jgi:hypothetical protein
VSPRVAPPPISRPALNLRKSRILAATAILRMANIKELLAHDEDDDAVAA